MYFVPFNHTNHLTLPAHSKDHRLVQRRCTAAGAGRALTGKKEMTLALPPEAVMARKHGQTPPVLCLQHQDHLHLLQANQNLDVPVNECLNCPVEEARA